MFYRVWQPYLFLRKLFKDEFAVVWYEPDHFRMHPWEWHIYEDEKYQLIYRQLDAACRWADVVVWMGLHTDKALGLFMHMQAKHGKRFVSEFDDYIYSIPVSNSAYRVYKPGTDFTRIAIQQMKASSALIVSTPHLKKLYAAYNPNVHIVENTIDTALWRNPNKHAGDKVVIGWVGGGTHNEDHVMIQKAVFEVLGKCQKAYFHYLSGCPMPKGYAHARIKWEEDFKSIDKYPKWVSRKGFDIGIAPLVDNEFNRGKSNLRWLEYSAMGIPTVAAPLIHFKQSIKHGKTGFLAGTHDQWVHYLTRLVSEPALRENIGGAARREVKKSWNPEIQARKYRDALEVIANAEPNASHVDDACRPAY